MSVELLAASLSWWPPSSRSSGGKSLSQDAHHVLYKDVSTMPWRNLSDDYVLCLLLPCIHTLFPRINIWFYSQTSDFGQLLAIAVFGSCPLGIFLQISSQSFYAYATRSEDFKSYDTKIWFFTDSGFFCIFYQMAVDFRPFINLSKSRFPKRW